MRALILFLLEKIPASLSSLRLNSVILLPQLSHLRIMCHEAQLLCVIFVLCCITLNNCGLRFRRQKSVDKDLKVILGSRARETNTGYMRPRLWGENTMRLNPRGRYQCPYLKLKP